MKKKKIILPVAAAALTAFAAWMIYTNVAIAVTEYTLSFRSLPSAFDGFRIAQVSDFHNTESACRAIVDGVRKAEPDMIAITGDIIYSRNVQIDCALELVGELSEIAPCYYVTGNHESRLTDEELERLLTGIRERGATVLRGEEKIVTKDGANISVLGVDDPDFFGDALFSVDITAEEISSKLTEGNFSVLLSHRPEFYDEYKKSGVNLVLAGHTHGGQVNLPFLGGVLVPDQGFFPEYDAGLFREEDFAMVISRGLGNSVMPVRFNNQREVVIIELKKEP